MRKNVLTFIALSTLASGINYLTYPLLGRILPASQYVDITVALSFLTQITTFLSSIIAITIGISKSEEHGKAHEKIAILQSILYKLFVGLTLLLFILSPIILRKIDISFLFVIPICLMMIVSIPIAVISGYLNGKARMTQLGLLTAISAALQCSVAVSAAIVTHNGVAAMISMAGSQLLTVLVVCKLFKSEGLPRVSTAVFKSVHIEDRGYMFTLARYTLFASFAIMAVNILQIADLLLVKTLQQSDIRFYTDMYVISRVVFFAGMILIWPFLSEINITVRHLNRKPFFKLLLFFAAITIGSILALISVGKPITSLLFGITYEQSIIAHIGILSIAYKFSFLVITAVVLYFIVLRNYAAIYLSLAATALIGGYALILSETASIESLLTTLNLIAGSLALVGIANVIVHRTKS